MYTIIVFVIIFGLLAIRRNKKFVKNTQSVFDNIDSIQDKLLFKNIYCTFKTFGGISNIAQNVYIFNNCIVLSESVTNLRNQKYYQSIAPTYIITNRIPENFTFDLFNNKMTEFKVDLDDKGNIILKGFVSNQNISSSIGFMNDFEVSIKIQTGKDKKFLDIELNRYGLK